jgi:hypothetical protein
MKTLFERKENCLLLISYASLKNWEESTSKENLSAEKSRLERVISDLFCKHKVDMDYNQFVLDFVKEHGREIVYGDEYTYDVEIPDEYSELNVNVMIDKLQRKAKGSKY